MKKYIIYMHLFPNDKKYIGITCKKPNARWENGLGYSESHQPVMYNAIQKYGWENIKHIILYENLSLQEAQEKEKELIACYNTNCHSKNSNGYNMTDGGEGTQGHVCTQESKEKMSHARIGKYKGDNCYKSKAVICDGKRYESITQFCNENNLSRGMVEKWLRGKSAMPPFWYEKHLHLKGENMNYNVQEKPWQIRIEYDGMIFESQAQFAKYLGCSPALICKWIKNNKIPDEIKQKGFKRIINST